MASLIPNFEYDIFISYRHNDNLEGWVTSFVESLEKELRGTLKESLTIYFDKNPHDGLLETHHVDKSLEGKLKCLIFIPIISQTYCDPKSFAWQHEFCAFNKLAQEDKLGRDIKLSNGNVASRILPIKIHDLDLEDKNTFENEIGGTLRAIEFIYKEPGVNRPLLPTDDRSINIEKTNYKNQVNKVANAIKEIIGGIQNQSKPPFERIVTGVSQPQPKTKRYFALASLTTIILIALGYFLYPKWVVGNEEIMDKSIAVLPFSNLSKDDQEYFSEGMTDIIISQLAKINEFRVLGRTSTLKYKDGKHNINEIAKELNVNYVVEGSVQRQGDDLRINVQLIRVNNEAHLWAEFYDRKWKDVFFIQSDVAKNIAKELKAVLSPVEVTEIDATPTNNLEAYNLYLKGRYYWAKRTVDGLRKAMDLFEQSIALDSAFIDAYAGLAEAYLLTNQFPGEFEWLDYLGKAKTIIDKSITLEPNSAAITIANARYYLNRGERNNANKLFVKSIQLDPSNVMARVWYAASLRNPDSEEAARQARIAFELDPASPFTHLAMGRSLFSTGKHEEAIDWIEKGIRETPDFHQFYQSLGLFAFLQGDFEAARKHNQTAIDLGHYQSHFDIIETYIQEKNNEEAKAYFSKLDIKIKQSNPLYTAFYYMDFGDSTMAQQYLDMTYEKYKFYDALDLITNEVSDSYYDKYRELPQYKIFFKRLQDGQSK